MLSREEALLQDLLQTFQAEAVEHLQTLNQALLQLERRPDDQQRQELLGAAFRAAHSLKGASRAVSLDEIGQLAHAIESTLQGARDANQVLDAATCDALYDQLDAIEIQEGGLLGGQDPVVELAALELVRAGEGQSAEEERVDPRHGAPDGASSSRENPREVETDEPVRR